jgi:hypothetical protein
MPQYRLFNFRKAHLLIVSNRIKLFSNWSDRTDDVNSIYANASDTDTHKNNPELGAAVLVSTSIVTVIELDR